MTIVWRLMLLAALHLGVLICFPDYSSFAPVTVFILFLLSCGGMVAATSMMTAIGLHKYFFMNRMMEFIMLVIVAIILLIFTPQIGGVRPWDKIMKGQYPSRHDIDRGLARFGFKDIKHIQSGVATAADKVGGSLQDAKAVVIKEAGR